MTLTRKRAAGLALALVLATCAIYVAWRLTRPPEGFLLGLHALDGDRALMLFRKNDGDDVYAWAALIGRDGELAWVTALPAVPPSTGHNPIVTAAGGIVTVRVERRAEGAQETVALRETDGSIAWSAPLGERPALIGAAVSRRAGDTVGEWVEPATAGGVGRLVGLSARSGRRAWVATFPSVGYPHVEPFGAGFLVRPSGAGFVVDPRSGSRRELPGRHRIRCVERDRVLLEEDGRLVSLEAGSATGRALPATLSGGAVQQCLRTAHDLVLWVVRDEVSKLVALDAATGTIRWELPVGQQAHVGRWFPPTTGEPPWPRFAFLPVRPPDGADPQLTAVEVIDLERGVLVARSRWLRDLLHCQLQRFSTRYYLSCGMRGVALLDGSTGRLGAAVGLRDVEASPWSLRGSRLWLHDHRWSAIDEARWVALDAATLRPVATGNPTLAVPDARAAFDTWLRFSPVRP